jgi:hypothetical protein
MAAAGELRQREEKAIMPGVLVKAGIKLVMAEEEAEAGTAAVLVYMITAAAVQAMLTYTMSLMLG